MSKWTDFLPEAVGAVLGFGTANMIGRYIGKPGVGSVMGIAALGFSTTQKKGVSAALKQFGFAVPAGDIETAINKMWGMDESGNSNESGADVAESNDQLTQLVEELSKVVSAIEAGKLSGHVAHAGDHDDVLHTADGEVLYLDDFRDDEEAGHQNFAEAMHF